MADITLYKGWRQVRLFPARREPKTEGGTAAGVESNFVSLILGTWAGPQSRARLVLGEMVYRPIRYEQIMKVAEAWDVRARRMFNGMGIYTGEKMFAFLYEAEIGLKLSPEDQQQALSIPGAEPLRPDPAMEPMREYVKMPIEVLDNFEQFTYWVERSTSYVRKKNGVA